MSPILNCIALLSLILARSFINAQNYGARLSSPYHRHSFIKRYDKPKEDVENQPRLRNQERVQHREHFMRSLRDKIEEENIGTRSDDLRIKQVQGLRRLDDLEQQVERSVPWNGDSWRNRVREYLEKRRSSKEVTNYIILNPKYQSVFQGGFKVESREIAVPGDRLLAEGIQIKDEEQDLPEKERKIPSTFLSPPGGDIQLADDTWREAFNTEIEMDVKTSSMSAVKEDVEITTSEATTADLFENLANTTLDILNDLDEVRELSVKAKTTLAKLQEFKNATEDGRNG
jgi:hypothetical protein